MIGQLVTQLEVAVGGDVPDADGVVHPAAGDDVSAFVDHGSSLWDSF